MSLGLAWDTWQHPAEINVSLAIMYDQNLCLMFNIFITVKDTWPCVFLVPLKILPLTSDTLVLPPWLLPAVALESSPERLHRRDKENKDDSSC